MRDADLSLPEKEPDREVEIRFRRSEERVCEIEMLREAIPSALAVLFLDCRNQWVGGSRRFALRGGRGQV